VKEDIRIVIILVVSEEPILVQPTGNAREKEPSVHSGADTTNDCISKMIKADVNHHRITDLFCQYYPEIKVFMNRAFFVARANYGLCAGRL
jgi:hypothetical protein